MRILLVEDEPTLSDQISAALIESGFVIDHADNGQDALHLGAEESYDAIILDLGLPIMDGMTVLKNWRAKGLTTPVLILTARDSWHDKVSGIDAGADDYLSKPFHMQELLARVRALIRRASGIASSTLRCGSVMLDTTSGRVTVDSQNVGLTAHELKVLSFLMHHQDEIISRTTLTEHIYAQDFDRDSNTIDVFIGRLRKKIPENMIETVRGLGYRMRASP
ncbi:MAG: response regulator transcription factor [Sheuella sp.]|nr:response regulator transcription factor [Sheuella sp.]